VRLNGRDVYLGPFGSPDSRRRYADLVASVAKGEAPKRSADPLGRFTVAELCDLYEQHAESYYRPGPSHRSHPTYLRIKNWVVEIAQRYGHLPADEFGPRSLRDVRDRWAASGRLCRAEVNRRQGDVVRMFRWGVAEELVAASTLNALKALAGLRAGKSEARETAPRTACTDEQIAAVLPHLTPPAASLVRMLRATGMRPDEACRMRIADIDATGEVWTYRVAEHKNSHRGHQRIVPLNATAQAIVRQHRLRPDGTERPDDAYLFDPAEGGRRNAYGRFLPNGLYQSLQDACDAADIDAFSPYAIRHRVGTELRSKLGIEAVEAVLGQRTPSVAERYSRDKTQRAMAAAASIWVSTENTAFCAISDTVGIGNACNERGDC
jgi:integrase